MSGNLFENIPDQLPEELFTILQQTESIKIERIVSSGQSTPPGEWYDQDSHEWVVLLSGSAEIVFENPTESKLVQSGDYMFIPAHRRHRVEWTSKDEKCVWLAVHFAG